jgi:hypothetical protein
VAAASDAEITADHRLVPGQYLVLIIVAAGGSPTTVAAVDLDVRRLPQDHLSFVARSITVMIKARVMRDLALLGCVPNDDQLAGLVWSVNNQLCHNAAVGRWERVRVAAGFAFGRWLQLGARPGSAGPAQFRGRLSLPCQDRPVPVVDDADLSPRLVSKQRRPPHSGPPACGGSSRP